MRQDESLSGAVKWLERFDPVSGWMEPTSNIPAPHSSHLVRLTAVLAILERRGDRLDDAIERAAGELPEGYIVRIEVETGCACFYVYDPEGVLLDFDEGDNDQSLSDKMNAAVEYARDHHGEVSHD